MFVGPLEWFRGDWFDVRGVLILIYSINYKPVVKFILRFRNVLTFGLVPELPRSFSNSYSYTCEKKQVSTNRHSTNGEIGTLNPMYREERITHSRYIYV